MSRKRKHRRRNTEKSLTYSSLEARCVLDASFAFAPMTSILTLDGFDSGSNLSIDQRNELVNGTVEDAYIFTLASGTWAGSGLPANEFEIVGNELRIDTDVFGASNALDANVVIDGTVGPGQEVALTQANVANDIEFETLSVANIRNVGTDLLLNVVGDLTLQNVDATSGSVDLMVAGDVVVGSVDVDGDLNLNIAGDLDQTAEIFVFGRTELIASGIIDLKNPSNDFTGAVDASATTVELVDVDGLRTGTITSIDNIFLRSGTGGLGGLTVAGNLTTTSASGQAKFWGRSQGSFTWPLVMFFAPSISVLPKVKKSANSPLRENWSPTN